MFLQLIFVLLLVCAATPSDILESPQPVQVMKGSPATLKCRTSSSSPTLEITWYKDGSQFLLDQKVGRCLLLPDGSLFFLTTSAEDTGDYYCAVTGRKLVVRSKSARLSVLGHGQEDQEMFSEEDNSDRLLVESTAAADQHSDHCHANGTWTRCPVLCSCHCCEWTSHDQLATL